MEKTISVRLPKAELKEISQISVIEKRRKSDVLREIVEKGVKEKKLEMALEKFQNNELTASRAAKLAGIPLTLFLDILQERQINFHYTIEELKEDMEDLV